MPWQHFENTPVYETFANSYLKEHLMLLLEIISLSAKHNINTLITQLRAPPQQNHPK